VTDWIVRRWARYGNERLYAETPGGTALGYLDLRTGRYHSDESLSSLLCMSRGPSFDLLVAIDGQARRVELAVLGESA